MKSALSDCTISNISTTSGLYSQLAGVLAGFAFTGLVLILTARLQAPSRNDSPVTILNATSGPLVSIVNAENVLPACVVHPRSDPRVSFANPTRVLNIAFLGLVLTSVNYAAMAGDTSGSPRTGFLELLDGLAFATSAIMMLYAISLMLDSITNAPGGPHMDLQDVGRFLRMVMGVILVPLLLLLLLLGVQDYEFGVQSYSAPVENSSISAVAPLSSGESAVQTSGAGQEKSEQVPVQGKNCEPSRQGTSTIDLVLLALILAEALLGALHYWHTSGGAGPLTGSALDSAIKKVGNWSLLLIMGSSIGATLISSLTVATTRIWIGWPVTVMLVGLVAGAALLRHLVDARQS